MKSMRLCIFEDRGVETLAPLIAARPAFTLRCGALTLAEKISYRIPRASVSFHVREYLSRLVREENRDIPVNRSDAGETWLVNGRVIADAELASFIRKNAGSKTMLVASGELVAVHVDRAIQGHLQDILEGDPLEAA